MREIAKKVQMIRLQEEHFGCHADAEQYCAKCCKIERERIKLEKNIVKKRIQKFQTTEEKWNSKCKKAVQLFNQGEEYPTIAKKLRCNVSSLYRELKKRGVLQMPKQVASSKALNSSIIPPQTKKSKFERYKEYYMYK
ncbi:hypothetical protein P9027_26310 [Bacillus thuringiensis]|uniref:hypothetical protein n=2 Tax=Bacillus thuringiensis TaxID=1428 RepID=UPI0007C1CDB8|nr:hypothetical protein [Bacillus thuringiensis]AND11111.1 hypothetical protein Bt4C1_28390 [Bacillus thuringiensis serovar alesti]MEC3225466.1 hypothetical protein [Bacillus thuringiensis]MEC3597917.1 hypothetical protein [Bacillus thuringiensis]MED1837321.1 hypothetical protein [Bacillus thuringiensis]MED2035226.1 hypothetical protein [Bacillus thuringiensis]